MNDFNDLYREIFENNNLHKYISQFYIDKFKLLTSEMLRVNEYMNLTSITDTADVIAKHYADSLIIADMIDTNASVIDVGTGAGFPSLPIAIVRPDLKITALDSTLKKLNYVSETAKLLRLNNVSVLHNRAEIIGHTDLRESFDYVCARAVASLNVLCEYCLPLVKTCGKCLAMKSLTASTEIDGACEAIEKLGGEMTENISFNLHTLHTTNSIQKRNVIIIQKVRPTPIIYPRNSAQINKNPL